MIELSTVCQEVLRQVEGAIACGVFDLTDSVVLAFHRLPEHSQPTEEAFTASALDLLGAAHRTGLAALLAGRGTQTGDLWEELYVASEQGFSFAKIVAEGELGIVLLTRRTANIGMCWAQLKNAVPSVATFPARRSLRR